MSDVKRGQLSGSAKISLHGTGVPKSRFSCEVPPGTPHESIAVAQVALTGPGSKVQLSLSASPASGIDASNADSQWPLRWTSLSRSFAEFADQRPTLHGSITAFEGSDVLAGAFAKYELEPIWRVVRPKPPNSCAPRQGVGKQPPMEVVRAHFQAQRPSLWLGLERPRRLRRGILGRKPEGLHPLLVSLWGQDDKRCQRFMNLAETAQGLLDRGPATTLKALSLPAFSSGALWQRWLLTLLVLPFRVDVDIGAALDPFVDEVDVQRALAVLTGGVPRETSWESWSQPELGGALGWKRPTSIVGWISEDLFLASERAAEWLALAATHPVYQSDTALLEVPKFEMQNEQWIAKYQGRSVPLGKSIGFLTLKHIVDRAGHWVSCRELFLASERSPFPESSTQEALDDEGQRLLRSRITDLSKEREAATREGDLAARERLDQELEKLKREIAKTAGSYRPVLTGAQRKAIDMIQARYRRARGEIKTAFPDLHKHLERCIRKADSQYIYDPREALPEEG